MFEASPAVQAVSILIKQSAEIMVFAGGRGEFLGAHLRENSLPHAPVPCIPVHAAALRTVDAAAQGEAGVERRVINRINAVETDD